MKTISSTADTTYTVTLEFSNDEVQFIRAAKEHSPLVWAQIVLGAVLSATDEPATPPSASNAVSA